MMCKNDRPGTDNQSEYEKCSIQQSVTIDKSDINSGR